MGNATYQFKKPFLFMKKGYSDSKSLVMAFLEHWDVAISVFRRGDMQSFWTEYVTDGEKEAADFFPKAYDAMWEDFEKEDALFQKVIRYIEPHLEGIPMVPAGEKTARLFSNSEMAEWLEKLFKVRFKELEIPETFNAKSYNLLWMDAAVKEGVLSTYVPGLAELEQQYLKCDNFDKAPVGRQIAAEISGVPYIKYLKDYYTSWEQLADKKLSGECSIKHIFQFCGELLGLEKWEAWCKTLPEETGQKLAELTGKWNELNALMTKSYDAEWYKDFKVRPVTDIEDFLTDRMPLFCDVEERERIAEEYLAEREEECAQAKAFLEQTAAQKAFLEAVKKLSAVKISDYYGEFSTQQLHCENIIEQCQWEIPYLKNLLPVIKTQDYAGYWERIEDDEKDYLFELAILPTPTMREPYISQMFEKLEQWVVQKPGGVEKKSFTESIYSLVKKLSESPQTDTKTVENVSVFDYYVERLNHLEGVFKANNIKSISDESWKKVCSLYGKRLAEPLKKSYDDLMAKSEKLRDVYSSSEPILSFKGDKPTKDSCHYSEYSKWVAARDSYQAMIEDYQSCHSYWQGDWKDLITKQIPDDEVPRGELISTKEKQCREAEEKLAIANRRYEKYREQLPGLKEKAAACKSSLDSAWEKEQEKQRKQREAQRRKDEKKRKRKEFFGRVWGIISFPFKVLLLPIILWSYNKLAAAIVDVVIVVLVVVAFRYASPTYYGTEHYWGNKLGYKHYKVAEGVTSIPSYTFKDATRMESIELPEGLQIIYGNAFEGCSVLKEVEIPASVTDIGSQAFAYCKSLEKVVFHGENVTLSGTVFFNCVSLTDIESATGKQNWDDVNGNAFEGCYNQDKSDVYGGILYRQVPEDLPLLGTEVQLKNFLAEKYISAKDNSGRNYQYQPGEDVLQNIHIGEERTTENGRSVTFTCAIQGDFVKYDITGTLTAVPTSPEGWEQVDAELFYQDTVTVVERMEAMQQQFAEGNYTELEAVLYKQSFTFAEQSIPMEEGQVAVEQAEIIPLFAEEVNEAGEKLMPEKPAYRIAFKAQVDKEMADFTLLGNLLLSEKYSYVPQMITNNAECNSINLVGTYRGWYDADAVFTINRQYEDVYAVTDNGIRRILVMNEDGKSGKLICTEDGNFYSLREVKLQFDKDGFSVNDVPYEKVNDETPELDEAYNNPLVGVWQGNYDTTKSYADSRRYILPTVGDTLTVLSKFGPTEQSPDFMSGATIDNIVQNGEYNNYIIESKAWYYQPKGYNFLIFEGGLDESGTTMSGEGKYAFTMTKTEPENDNYTYGTNEGEDWSIYDRNGEVREEFTAGEEVPVNLSLYLNGSYYAFYKDAATWEEAKENCEGLGGHLAIIDSAEENAFLHAQFVKTGQDRCYFGLSDAAEEGNWMWVDGISVGERYSNWNKAEPNANNVSQDYGQFLNSYSDGTWDDCEYINGAYYICEWE